MMHILKDKNILLIISGGIAAYKALELIRMLKTQGAHVNAILTKGGAQFVTPLSISALTGQKTYTDLWDLKDEAEMGHIRLSRENDLIMIVPASADLMAKMAHGLANDLASTTLLASDKPVMIAPAMNPMMWQNAATQDNIKTLKGRGFLFSGPMQGQMACGETGYGRLREPADIMNDMTTFFETISPSVQSLDKSNILPLTGKKAIVTSGPTYEPLDPVRFIGNYSSGKQGHAIATALAEQGAEVTLITGPTAEPLPASPLIQIIKVQTAIQMHEAVHQNMPADIAICAAAVADWRLPETAPHKMKKQADQDQLQITLVKNPDILQSIGSMPASKRPKMVVGFAAETNDVLENAKIKLNTKNADMIIANAVNNQSSVFGAEDNHVYVITHDNMMEWQSQSKISIARKLVTLITETYILPQNTTKQDAA